MELKDGLLHLSSFMTVALGILVIVPLVCAFFIDLANAMIIPFFLGRF